MRERNAPVPPDKRIELRIGIHVGDIIIEEGDIFGDGVNIAARLENIAEPGGICISDDTYRQVRGKIDVTFEDGGNKHLKNIDHPVRVYRAQFGASAGMLSGQQHALPDRASVMRPYALLAPPMVLLTAKTAATPRTMLSKVSRLRPGRRDMSRRL